MFHIVFDSGGAGLLSAAMDLDDALDGETIVIEDDYSVGPIGNLYSPEGRQERSAWWNVIREEDPASGTGFADDAHLQVILRRMEEEEFDQIWIWVAPNIKDVSGYYWLISQLGQFADRIYIISLNNLPFINEKGNVFYPTALSEIPAREFVKAKKLARPVTGAEFETDPDEWTKLSSENKNLRMLEGGKKIIQQNDEYYDRALLNFLQPVFQKITRTMQQFLIKSPGKANELFLTWRLKQLVDSGFAEQQGETIRLAVKVEDGVDNY
jgi:Domain of unknown function (DUF1835)/Protein of unknown function